MQNARKIVIHVRKPKNQGDTHVHKKARAHYHIHEHDHVRKQAQLLHLATLVPIKNINVGNNEIHPHAEPLVPARLVVPRKPLMVEGIPMSSYSIAYFCMEMGIENSIPTYSGGLGILAGDMLRSCADLKIDTIGVSLLYRGGYFKQRFDNSGWQIEEEENWNPYEKLILLPGEISVMIESRIVRVRAWLHKIHGVSGNTNPIIFLDTDVELNTPEDRSITKRLYYGNSRARLMQEIILGIGGVRMLEKLGATNIQKFHMNEGHSALLTLEVYRQYASCDDPAYEVRRRSVFTTHTPVAVGHDHFDERLVLSVLGEDYIPPPIRHMVLKDGELNMTRLGFAFSEHVNGVAKRHGEVTRELFPGYQIESITNGVHAGEWVSGPLARLYDNYLPGWRVDPYSLRYALSIPLPELEDAHQEAKQLLFKYIADTQHVQLNPHLLTIGFARRATAYKRANLLFRDINRLKYIAEKSNGIQIIFAGKAHHDDHGGKLLMQEIIRNMKIDSSKITCIYLPNYDMSLAKLLVGGVDLWLNTPARPQEASGTSGMKAALNGVPQFSVLDGWWLEGHIENVTGWSIGPHPEKGASNDPDNEDANDLYTKLEYVIIPRFEGDKNTWVMMMRSAIAVNGSFFNTHRMVEQYVLGAYFK